MKNNKMFAIIGRSDWKDLTPGQLKKWRESLNKSNPNIEHISFSEFKDRLFSEDALYLYFCKTCGHSFKSKDKNEKFCFNCFCESIVFDRILNEREINI